MQYTIIDVSPNEMQGTYVVTAQAKDSQGLVLVASVDAKIMKSFPSAKAKAAIHKALDVKYEMVNGSPKANATTSTFRRKQFIGQTVGDIVETKETED